MNWSRIKCRFGRHTWGRAYIDPQDWLLKECLVCGKRRYWWQTPGARRRDVLSRVWMVKP